MHLPTFQVRSICIAATLLLNAQWATAQQTSVGTEVELDTTEGRIVIEVHADEAPKTVANFLQYVVNGHYEGTVFHRVIPDFMIQCGGMDENLHEKKTRLPVRNEAHNGLKNKKYTVAMARKPDPDSATCQFFINTGEKNEFLNRDEARGNAGYTVFGTVVQGLEVVDKISNTQTHVRSNPAAPSILMEHVPVTPIVIKSAKVLSNNRY
jgi:cyclophilin family peptidyl-prolyl cis-trans isomerase